MEAQFQPWQLLLLTLAGWINRRQQDAMEYLLTKNRVLREKLGKNRILLSDDKRRRLAVKGKILGRKLLEQVAGIVTPDTILRWPRELAARHWDCGGRRRNVGRPPVTWRAGNGWVRCCVTITDKLLNPPVQKCRRAPNRVAACR